LSEDIFDSEISIENYTFARIDRKSDLKTKGGGIIIYVHQGLSFINVTTEVDNNIDCLWIKVQGKIFSSVTLGVFYRPPDSNDEHLKFLIKSMSKFKTQRTLLIGDFNFGDINWRNYTSGRIGAAFLKAVKNLALNQCVKEKTRGNNILDLVLVYEKDLVYKLEYLPPVGKSDHSTLKVTLNVTVNRQNRCMDSFNYNQANYGLLEDKLNSIDWEMKIGRRTVEEYWTFLMNLLNDFKENHIPKFNRQVNNKLPWYNNRIKKMIKYRNNLFKRLKKMGQSYFRIKYNMARNRVTKQIRLAKSKYEFKIVKRSKNNGKIFYIYLQSKNKK